MEVIGNKTPICKYCGKEYIENQNIPADFPEWIKQAMKYIPACDCEKVAEEKRRKEEEKQRQKECITNKVKKYKDISVIDKKFLNSTFKNADMTEKHMITSKKYADKFIADGTAKGGILFYGGVGTGKTFASACICNELMDNGKTVLVMNLGLYLIKIQREWAEAENDVLNYVKSCDLLVIDDLGIEKVTPFVLEKVFTLIDTRYRSDKPMIITSNLSLDDIKQTFGDRIADRITERCLEYNVIGDSKRKFDKKAFAAWLMS